MMRSKSSRRVKIKKKCLNERRKQTNYLNKGEQNNVAEEQGRQMAFIQ